MAIDFTKPITTDNYSTGVLQAIVANTVALGQWLDTSIVTVTGTPPTGTKRFNSSTGIIENYTGSVWATLSMGYLPTTGGMMSGQTLSTYAEALRINANGGFISGYNTAGSIRNGYLQFSDTEVVLSADPAIGIRFLTNGGNERMRIDSGGNVGIGKTPITVLDVSLVGGTARFGGASGNNVLQTYSSSIGGGIWAGGLTRIFSSSSMTLSTNATLTSSFPTGYIDAVTIDSTGNVGIGVIPASRLHVKTSSAEISRLETTTARGGGSSYSSWYDPTGRKGYMGYAGGTDDLYFYNEMNAGISIGTNGSQRVSIDVNGNVGIGRSPVGEILETNRAIAVFGSLQSATGPKFALDYIPGTSRLLSFGSSAGTPGTFDFYQASSDNTVSRTAMSINSSGNVGINIAPASKLDVSASAIAIYARSDNEAGGTIFASVNNNAGGVEQLVIKHLLADVHIGNVRNGALKFLANNSVALQVSAAGVVADASGNELGYKVVPLVTNTGNSTLVIGDRGKAHYKTDATQVTIPASIFSAGDVVTIFNWSTSNMTIVQGGSMTMYKGGTATTGNRTLLGVGTATILFQSATACTINGNIT